MGAQFTIGSEVLPLLMAAYVLVLLVLWARGRRYSGPQYVALTTFVVYALVVVHLVLLPIRASQPISANFDPFVTFANWRFSVNYLPLVNADAPQFRMNVVLFVPFGLLLPFLIATYESLARVAWTAFMTSPMLELVQLAILAFLRSGRSTGIDDVIANTLGAVIGYLVQAALEEWPHQMAQARAFTCEVMHTGARQPSRTVLKIAASLVAHLMRGFGTHFKQDFKDGCRIRSKVS